MQSEVYRTVKLLGKPTTHHMRVDMRRPTPIQSTMTTHSSSFRVSTAPMSSTRPKPSVDTAEEERERRVIAAPWRHPDATLPRLQTHHTARRRAGPGTPGRPWPTGLWSASCSGSCGRLSAATWTSKASATQQSQSPSVWSGAAVAGTCSAWSLPCGGPWR